MFSLRPAFIPFHKTALNNIPTLKLKLLALLCFGAFSNQLFSQTAPTIQLCDQAAPEICMVGPTLDICVSFVVDPTYNEEIDHYELDWLDGSPIIMLPADDPLDDQVHTYDVSRIFGNCTWENDDFRVRLRTVLANGSAPNNSVDLFLRNPPQATIMPPSSFACVGTEICLTNDSCPSQQLTSSWDFGTGLPPSENNCFTYQDTGTYVITLTATNPCNQDIDQFTLRVIDAPAATAVPRASVIQGNSSPYRACIEGQTCISLDGTGSTGADLLRWTVDAPASIITINHSDSIVAEACFSTIREYTFTLTAENTLCDLEDVASFTVEAIAGEPLVLDQQPDACPSLSYTPTPAVDPDATYFIDGAPVSSFPFMMTARASPYIIRAEKNTECGPLEANDTIFVEPAVQPMLIAPADGEAFCPDTSLVAIQVSDADGSWAMVPGLVLMGEDAFFDLSAPAGDYTFTYTSGAGDCERSLSLTLSIEESALSLPEDFFICTTASPVALMPAPAGGELSGDGVDNASRTFSPAGLSPGSYPIVYSRTNTMTTCTEVGSWNAEIVGEPTVEAGAPISLCNTNQVIDLLANTDGFAFSPPLAEPFFSGRGIVDPAMGSYRPGDLNVGETDTVLITYSDPRTLGICSATDTLFVTITGIITPEAGADTTICGSSDTYFLGAAAGGSWSGPSADADGTVDISSLTPGTYGFTLTLGEGFCQSSDEVSLTITPGDGVALAEPAAFLCDTAARLRLPAVTAGPGGRWSGDLPLTEPFIDVSGAAAGAYDFLYTVDGLPAGCNSAPFRVEIAPRPITSLRADSIACNDGSCISLVAGGTPADSYQWRASDGLSTTGDSICHQFPQAGDYTVTLRGQRRHPVNNTVLCSSPEVSSMIRLLDPPQAATITISQDTICPGEELALQFTPPASAGRETLVYEWQYGDTAFIAEGLTMISFPSPIEDTMYTITLNTLGTCDRAQATFPLVVRANPVANIGVVYPENCSGSELILTNLATGTADFTEWTSSDGQRFTSYQPPVLTPVTGDAARTINYSLTVGNSCRQDTYSVPVVVEPTAIRALPELTDTTVCLGQPFIVNNISTPGTSVEYVFSDGRRLTTDSVAIFFDEPGPISFTIYAYGCGYDSSNWTGTILPEPDINFMAPSFTCPYSALPYTLQSDAASTMVYFGDGDSTNQNIGTHVYGPATGPLTLSYMAVSHQGCRAEGSQTLTVLPQPVAAIAPLDTLCANQEQLISSTGSGGETCRWHFGDGQGDDGCQVSHAYAEDGLYSLQLIYTSGEGCADTALAPAFVRPTPDIMVNLTYDSTRCGPTEVQFQYSGNLNDASSFQLFPGDGSGPLSSLNPTHRFDTSGLITASLRTGYDDVCFMDTDISFYLRQYPRARTQVQDDRCEQGEFMTVAVLTENTEDLIMGSGPENYFADGINQFNLVTPGDYVFEVISPDGCDTLIDISVPPVRPLRLSTIGNTLIALGDSIELLTQINSNNTLLSWAPGGSLSDSTALSPWAKPLTTTYYIVEALDTVTNCILKDSVRIGTVQETDIFVPSAFSPNGDGINDGLTIFPKVSVVRIDNLRIYNRWGGMVFEVVAEAGSSVPPLTPLWDGRLNGRTLNPAVFIYTIEYETVTGEKKVQRGDLTVLSAGER